MTGWTVSHVKWEKWPYVVVAMGNVAVNRENIDICNCIESVAVDIASGSICNTHIHSMYGNRRNTTIGPEKLISIFLGKLMQRIMCM